MNPTTLTRLTSILTFLLVGIGTAVAQLPPPPAQPIVVPRGLGEIEFEATLHEFGAIWDHEKATQEFKFTNVGTETLNILDVRSTCGCTVPELTKTDYQPGESGVITVIFNPENRVGNQVKTINVTTDSRATPRVGLTITATVEKVLDIQPRLANLGRVFKGEEKGLVINILGSVPDFKVMPAEKQPADTMRIFELTHIEDKPVDVAGKMTPRSSLRVTLKPGLPVGRHSADLVMKTTDPRRPEISLHATVTIVGDLQARPPRFALGRLVPETNFEAEVVLVNRVAKPFKITKIEPGNDLEGLEFETMPVVEGQFDAYKIIVRGMAPADQNRILGNITVHTDLEGEETMELPIYGFVSASPQIGQATPARTGRSALGDG